MDFLTNPFIAALLILYQVLARNIVLTIVVFTVLTRLLTFPLTRAQIKSSRGMQALSPKLKEIQKKYKGDREKLSQEQMKLYKDAGINPVAGCLPLVIQMPILFGLYGAIRVALATNPMDFVDLNHRLLIPLAANLLPLQNRFLWLNLGQPDPLFILPILVVATTFLQSKLMTPTNSSDPSDPSVAMTRNMTIMMPLMIGFLSLTFASGLSIYWVVANLVGIGQYAAMGRIDWRAVFGRQPAIVTAGTRITSGKADRIEAPKSKVITSAELTPKLSVTNKKPGVSKAAGKPKASKAK